MTAKEQALELLSQLPDDCTTEDIVYHLYIREKVQRGREDVKNGRVHTHEEARKRLARWLGE